MAEVDEGYVATDPNFGADASSETADEPVEVDAKAAEAEPEPESEGDSPPPDEQNVEEKSDTFQKRIDKLTGSFRESEREGDALRQEGLAKDKRIAELEQQAEPQQQAKTLADFEYDEDKYRAYVFDEARSIAEKAAKRVLQEQQTAVRVDEVTEKFAQREKDFAKTVGDYLEVTRDKSLKISESMAGEIRNLDIGPQMAYHLANNPDESRRISKLSDREVVREMQLLETTMRSEMAKASKKVSDAPPPPAKIQGREPGMKTATTDPRSDKMSDKEWFAAEDKRNAKLRG